MNVFLTWWIIETADSGISHAICVIIKIIKSDVGKNSHHWHNSPFRALAVLYLTEFSYTYYPLDAEWWMIGPLTEEPTNKILLKTSIPRVNSVHTWPSLMGLKCQTREQRICPSQRIYAQNL